MRRLLGRAEGSSEAAVLTSEASTRAQDEHRRGGDTSIPAASALLFLLDDADAGPEEMTQLMAPELVP